MNADILNVFTLFRYTQAAFCSWDGGSVSGGDLDTRDGVEEGYSAHLLRHDGV